MAGNVGDLLKQATQAMMARYDGTTSLCALNSTKKTCTGLTLLVQCVHNALFAAMLTKKNSPKIFVFVFFFFVVCSHMLACLSIFESDEGSGSSRGLIEKRRSVTGAILCTSGRIGNSSAVHVPKMLRILLLILMPRIPSYNFFSFL